MRDVSKGLKENSKYSECKTVINEAMSIIDCLLKMGLPPHLVAEVLPTTLPYKRHPEMEIRAFVYEKSGVGIIEVRYEEHKVTFEVEMSLESDP